MKKVKDIESKDNDTSLEVVKEGKIKKKKQKKDKKLEEAVAITEHLDLAPNIAKENLKPTNNNEDGAADKTKKKKNKTATQEENQQESKVEAPKVANDESKPEKQEKLKKSKKSKEHLDLASNIAKANLKPTNNNEDGAADKTKKKKHKTANQEENHQESMAEAPKVANNESKPEKQEKQKKFKKNKEEQNSETEAPVKELTEADIKKIEKKKANKLSQKLSKKLKKQRNRSENKDVQASQKAAPTTNGVNEGEKPQKTADKDENTAPVNKVLLKKEKKAQKKQLMKQQKLAEQRTRDPAKEAATIFIGNVPVKTKRIQLIRLLEDFKPVNYIRLRSAVGQVLHKHKQRREAGSLNAYVELKDKETAEKALSLNGTKFRGHHLRITLAAKNPHTHQMEEGKRTVFVGNLKYSATEESLHEIFSSCGEIDYVRCLRDGEKGCKGVAYVCFKTPDAVGLALELKQTMLDERPITVERFNVKKLGAKEKRDAEAEKQQKSKKGAKQRIDGKKYKKDKSVAKKPTSPEGEEKKPKKSEFRGVKVEGLKKKSKLKKKKSRDQNLQLAKKIAPKAKSE